MVWDGPAGKAALPVDRGTLGGMAPPAGGMGEEPVWVAPVVWAGAAGVEYHRLLPILNYFATKLGQSMAGQGQ